MEEIHSYDPKPPWWRGPWVWTVLWLALALVSRRWWYLVIPAAVFVGDWAFRRWGSRTAALTLGAHGLSIGGVDMPWSNVKRIESVERARRRSDNLVLDRGIIRTHAKGVNRTFDLRRFDPNWRAGPIGEDIRRWAPHLLLEDRAGTRV